MNDRISDTITVDTSRLPLLLNELRLPTIAAMWPTFTERADREGWPATRLLATLAELEPSLQRELEGQSILLQSHDFREGARAFQQHRAPAFTDS